MVALIIIIIIWSHGYSYTDKAFPDVEETLTKRFKRQRLNTSEELFIYKQVIDEKIPLNQLLSRSLSDTKIKEIANKTEKVHWSKLTMFSRINELKWIFIS